MTVYLDLTAVVVATLLCIATTANAQSRSSMQVDDLPASALPKTKAVPAASAVPVLSNTASKQSAARALPTAPVAALSPTAKGTDAVESVDTTPSNGRFSSVGTTALIPVGRLGWHEISDWREVRRARPSR